MKRTKNMIYQPSIESRELELYAENHAHLYMLRIDPLLHSLAKKYHSGIYEPDRAADAYFRIACDAAGYYSRDFGPCLFTVGERFTAAVEMEKYFRDIVCDIAEELNKKGPAC